ncbi:hydrolase, alpha/beta fold family protein [Beauveria bassiana ARSEF 2860]|uniref:Hydrolase, alpha/beta fold family protein n=1 Tax=Beauveria bassiana (strain ARSEF 2860) TaxID=655819 RepID=J4KP30_BEAB2|nr:hydrolase, alpha/beta fold family protein [Beauveria bassiana ARSEF 2860]EJP66739.1 hydrolase, alpha/beta fold family protein [Beauveria bassiana ARSEF 2860]
MFKLALASAAFVTAAVAAHNGKDCHDILVPVTVDTTLKSFDYTPTDEEIDTTNFFLDFTRHGGDFMTRIITSNDSHIHKDYTLAATICHPPSGPSSTLQILTHGVGFDRSYWDYPFASYNYSYVAHALDAGHSTLTWDRLGIAQSSHGDPVQEIQLALEVEALHQLTLRARDAHLCGLEGHRFARTVHVGHSFGSAMTYSLSSKYPDITDAIVLTGFSQAPAYMALFALGADFAPVASVSPRLKEQYVTGYIAPKTSIGVHIDFFGPGDFSADMLQDATAHGQPAALGELLTVADGAAAPSNYTGAVYIITGEYDVPFCGGNCNMPMQGSDASNILTMSEPMFKQAKSFNTTIVPGAGHGLNFGYSHTVTYQDMLDFLKEKL